MGKILFLILSWFTSHIISSFFKYLFSSIIGVISYQFVQILINRYIESAVTNLNSIGPIALVFDLAQFDVAISIIFGALAIRGSIIAMGLAIVKPQS